MNVGAVGATGGSAANQLAAEADVVLAIGTRLADFTTGSKTTFHPEATFIGLNVSPLDANKLFALPLVGDAKRGLESLSSALEGFTGTSDTYRQKVHSAKGKLGTVRLTRFLKLMTPKTWHRAQSSVWSMKSWAKMPP